MQHASLVCCAQLVEEHDAVGNCHGTAWLGAHWGIRLFTKFGTSNPPFCWNVHKSLYPSSNKSVYTGPVGPSLLAHGKALLTYTIDAGRHRH